MTDREFLYKLLGFTEATEVITGNNLAIQIKAHLEPFKLDPTINKRVETRSPYILSSLPPYPYSCLPKKLPLSGCTCQGIGSACTCNS